MSAYTTPSDTSPQARAVQTRLLRSRTAQQRVAQVFELNALLCALIAKDSKDDARQLLKRLGMGDNLPPPVLERYNARSRTMSPLFALIGRVVQTLEALRIPYLVAGSIASSRYGEARTTQDIDLVAIIQPDQVEPLVQALQGEFYIDPEMIREAIAHHSSFNIIHYESAFKIDFFLPELDEWHRQLFARRRQEPFEIEGTRYTLAFASPEDVILHKLVWYRAGNEVSERQWRDIIGMMEVQAELLEWDYLKHWAEHWGVMDLLERAWKQAGIT